VHASNVTHAEVLSHVQAAAFYTTRPGIVIRVGKRNKHDV
jgi:hypothetical protein